MNSLNCVLAWRNNTQSIYYTIRPLYIIKFFKAENKFYLLGVVTFIRYKYAAIFYRYFCDFVDEDRNDKYHFDKEEVVYISEDLNKCRSRLEYLNLLS